MQPPLVAATDTFYHGTSYLQPAATSELGSHQFGDYS